MLPTTATITSAVTAADPTAARAFMVILAFRGFAALVLVAAAVLAAS